MLFFENLLLAFTALLTNKMRSLLTMLGIIIGIALGLSACGLFSGIKNVKEEIK